MTSIACWFIKEGDTNTPWVVSDSRVSYDGESNRQILSDRGAKIYSFPLLVRRQWGIGDITHQANIGVAIAGNALVAHNTMLCLSSFCSNLIGDSEHASQLSLEHIADLASRVMAQFMLGVGQVMPRQAPAELALTGWCPLTNRWRIFHVKPEIVGALTMNISEFIPVKDDDVLLLGAYKEEILAEINNVRAEISAHTLSWQRAPYRTIASIIERKQYESIGGAIQLGTGIVNRNFLICAPFRPSEWKDGHWNAPYLFMGFDVMGEFRNVGPCILGTMGVGD